MGRGSSTAGAEPNVLYAGRPFRSRSPYISFKRLPTWLQDYHQTVIYEFNQPQVRAQRNFERIIQELPLEAEPLLKQARKQIALARLPHVEGSLATVPRTPWADATRAHIFDIQQLVKTAKMLGATHLDPQATKELVAHTQAAYETVDEMHPRNDPTSVPWAQAQLIMVSMRALGSEIDPDIPDVERLFPSHTISKVARMRGLMAPSGSDEIYARIAYQDEIEALNSELNKIIKVVGR